MVNLTVRFDHANKVVDAMRVCRLCAGCVRPRARDDKVCRLNVGSRHKQRIVMYDVT